MNSSEVSIISGNSSSIATSGTTMVFNMPRPSMASRPPLAL